MSKITQDQMDVVMTDGDKLLVQIADAGDMAFIRARVPAGSDFTETLSAVSPNRCEVPHWMFVVSGSLFIGHNDGRVDHGTAGDFIYAEPGHTAWCDADSEFVEVSPREGARDLFAAIAALAATPA